MSVSSKGKISGGKYFSSHVEENIEILAWLFVCMFVSQTAGDMGGAEVVHLFVHEKIKINFTTLFFFPPISLKGKDSISLTYYTF